MERFKLFISNFLVYGLGGIISKIIPFIMLPIITRLMPSSAYFGLNDITTIIVSFGSALAIMGMYDAMFRMFFDDDSMEYKRKVCSTTLAFVFTTTLTVCVILGVFNKGITKLVYGEEQYVALLFLAIISILIGTTNSILGAPTRFNNERKVYLVTNTLGPVISYAISIPLLLNGYYLLALPLASITSVTCIGVIFYIRNQKWFSFKEVDWKLLKPLLMIALPLLPNFLIYWIFNSADKLMITHYLGADSTGIYAVGGRIGQMSQLIYTAFAGGWQYFAFSTMNDEDQVKMTSNVLEYLAAITVVASIGMMVINKLMFSVLFTAEYLDAYIVTPYLFMAPLLLMLFQVGCNQFIVVKKTWPNVLILSFGAIMNLILNYTLIPRIGIEGAAIATLIGYVISVIVCLVVLKRMELILVSKRLFIVFLVGAIYLVMWKYIFIDNGYLNILAGVMSISFISFLFIYDIKILMHKKEDK